jgi:alkylation response protein AidB-like acyl-CoA dehydrogenase
MIMGGGQIAFANQDNERAVVAKETSTGYVLTGGKVVVQGGNGAEIFLVSADVGKSGRGVFVVPKQTRGLTTYPFKMVDEKRAANLNLTDVQLPKSARLDRKGDASSDIEHVVLSAIGALCSDAVGSIAALVQATVDYSKTRVQFGQAIGKFQALQHRMVDMKVKEEEARASCLFATLSLAQGPSTSHRAVYGAKAKIGRCARSVYQNAIQLHGAIGTTNELALGAYAKRLVAFEILFGTTRDFLHRYSSAISVPNVAAQGLLSPSI